MANEDVSVKFGASTGDLLSGISNVKSSIAGIGDSTTGLVSSFVSIGSSIAAAFAVDKLIDFAEKVGDIAEELQRTAEMTGMAAEEILAFQSAAKMSGGTAESATAALMFLEKNMSKAASGSKEATLALRDAGISMSTIKSGNASEALKEMADHFTKFADGAGKIEVATNAAGRGGKELIPVLNQGREGLKKLKKTTSESNSALLKYGGTFGEVEDNIKRMNGASSNLWNTLYAKLAPELNATVIMFTEWSRSMTKSIEEGGLLGSVVHALGVGLNSVVVALHSIMTASEVVWNTMVGSIQWAIEEVLGLGRAISALVNRDFKGAMAALKQGNAMAAGDFSARWDMAKKSVDDFWDSFIKVSTAANKAPEGIAGKKEKDDRPQMRSTPYVDMAKDHAALMEKERSGYQDTYDLLKQLDEMKVASGQMTNEEMFADLQNALDKTHDLIMASFADQDKMYADDKVKHDQLMADKASAEKKYISQKLKLEADANAQSKKTWDAAFNAIENSFDQMLIGVLRGTQTMGQAFKNMAANLVLSMMEACAKMALQWIKKEAMETAATLSGNATRTASNLAANATSSIGEKAAASEGIMTKAAESAANVYENVSAIPYVGWILAPPAAAAAFAAVAAFNSFEQGADFIPTNMTANIHKGERIVPAADNKKLIEAVENGTGSGGGPAVHLHVHAMDSRDVKRFLAKHKREVGSSMKSWARSGGRTSFAT